MGRPSIKTPELIEAICERLETGEPLAQICRDDDMPSLRPCYQWQEDDPAVKARFARAREVGFDMIALKALSIADERHEDPASRRVMVETRLKLLAKWDPKRYGDKTLIGSDPENPLPSPLDMSGLSTAALKELAKLAPNS